MDKKFTIIVPIYNVEDYLAECLNSIINQTYTKYEVICINDGSTDSSRTVLMSYEDKINNLKIIDQKNKGLSETRNLGIKLSKGDYILFLDSDDILKNDALEKINDKCKNNEFDLITFDALAFDEISGKKNIRKYDRSKFFNNSLITKEDYLINVYKKFISLTQLHCYRREFLLKHKIYFKPNILHEDTHHTLLAYEYMENIAYINERLYFRRYRPNSIMTGNLYSNKKSLESYIWIVREFSSVYEQCDNEYLKKIIDKNIRNILSNLIRYESYSFRKLIALSSETKFKLKLPRVFMNYLFYKVIKRVSG